MLVQPAINISRQFWANYPLSAQQYSSDVCLKKIYIHIPVHLHNNLPYDLYTILKKMSLELNQTKPLINF